MRSPKLLTAAVSLAALSALLAGGCGGGGDDSTESTATTVETTALTKADLIAQGNAICGEVNAAIGALGASAEAGDTTVKTADLYIGMVESIKRLGPPDESEGYADFIASAEDLSAVEAEAKLASEREDSGVVSEASTRAAPILEEFSSAADEYGFEECSEGPSAPATTGPGSGVAPSEEESEGGIEVAPEEIEEEAPVEEVVPEEEVAPETGGAGGGVEEAAPEAGGGSSGGSSGGVGPG
jgi:hypothetical protein